MEYALKSLELDKDRDYDKEIVFYCLFRKEDGFNYDSLLQKYQNTCFYHMLKAQKEIIKKNFPVAHEILIKAEQLNPTPGEMFNISYLYSKLKNLDLIIYVVYMKHLRIAIIIWMILIRLLNIR